MYADIQFVWIKQRLKNVLRQFIMEKNTVIAQKIEDGPTLKVTFINEKLKSAVIKVSPEIAKLLTMNKRTHIDMVSCPLSSYFHVLPCFLCQQFGHLAKKVQRMRRKRYIFVLKRQA